MRLLMEAVEDGYLGFPSFRDEASQVSDSVALCKAFGEYSVELPLWMEEVVVGVEEKNCGLGGHLGAGCVRSMGLQGTRFEAHPRSFCRFIGGRATCQTIPIRVGTKYLLRM